MVEITSCEKCKITGVRSLTRKAPTGWYYMLVDVEHAELSPGVPAKIYVFACSRTCAMALWLTGPGPEGPAVVYDPHNHTRNAPLR